MLILWTDLSPVLQALPAALASVSAALVGIYGWQDNKARFAFTAEALKSEKIKYETRTASTAATRRGRCTASSGRIEAIAMAETAEWRNAFVEAGHTADEHAAEEPRPTSPSPALARRLALELLDAAREEAPLALARRELDRTPVRRDRLVAAVDPP